MTKTELIDQVAAASGLTKKDSGKAIDAIFDTITQTLSEGEKVQLIGFGSFETRHREARKGRNPQTGAEIEIPAQILPVFTAGKALKEAVNQA
jgi:DNA-binding protein HU-beta